MIAFANAKINIGLFITSRRNDGYHNIESIFYPVSVCDVLEIAKTDGPTSLNIYGCGLSNDSNNLCIQAYNLMKLDYPALAPVSIHLVKNIPIGAGMGGGSSDAAHVLKLLSRINNLGLSDEELSNYARRLGADCSFFIRNQAAYVEGIGDKIRPIDLDLSSYFVAIIKPVLSISTHDAYKHIKPRKAPINLIETTRFPIEHWRETVYNQFEEHLSTEYPEIGRIKEHLYSSGAIYASMTGSGSAVFGIFYTKPDLSHLEHFGDIYYQTDII